MNHHAIHHKTKTPIGIFVAELILLTVASFATPILGHPGWMSFLLLPLVLQLLSAGIFASLLSITQFSPIAWISAPLVFAATWILFSSPIPAFFTLLYLPIGLCIALCVKRRMNRINTTLICAVVAGISFVILFGIILFYVYGSLSLNTFQTFFNAVKTEFLTIRETLYQSFIESEMITAADLESILKAVELSLLVMLPATIICFFLIFAYVATAFFRLSLKITRKDSYLYDSKWVLFPSVVSAWIFIVGYILQIFSNGIDITLLYAVSMNISTILTPCFFYVGIRYIFYTMRYRKNSFSITLLILLAFTLFIDLSSFFGITALYGAFSVISKHRFEKWKQKGFIPPFPSQEDKHNSDSQNSSEEDNSDSTPPEDKN